MNIVRKRILLVVVSLFSSLLMAIPVLGPGGSVTCPYGCTIKIVPGGVLACDKDGCVFVPGQEAGSIGDI